MPSVASCLGNNICVLPTDVQLKVLRRMAFEEADPAPPASGPGGLTAPPLGPERPLQTSGAGPVARRDNCLACCFSQRVMNFWSRDATWLLGAFPCRLQRPAWVTNGTLPGSPGNCKWQSFWLTMQLWGTRLCVPAPWTWCLSSLCRLGLLLYLPGGSGLGGQDALANQPFWVSAIQTLVLFLSWMDYDTHYYEEKKRNLVL